MLLSNKKHTDTLVDKTKTKPQETFEFKINKQKDTFTFPFPIFISEEGNWFLTVSSFEATISPSVKTDENNSFSITTQGHWSFRGRAEAINKLKKILEMRDINDVKLHVEEVRKRGNQIKTGHKEFKLSDFDTRKIEFNKKLKNGEYNDLEDIVFRMELTYKEIEYILDVEYIDASTTGYILPQDIYEKGDFNLML